MLKNTGSHNTTKKAAHLRFAGLQVDRGVPFSSAPFWGRTGVGPGWGKEEVVRRELGACEEPEVVSSFPLRGTLPTWQFCLGQPSLSRGPLSLLGGVLLSFP